MNRRGQGPEGGGNDLSEFERAPDSIVGRAIIEGIVKGDPESERVFYLELRKKFLLTLKTIAGDDCEDVLHKVYCMAVEAIKTGRIADITKVWSYVDKTLRIQAWKSVKEHKAGKFGIGRSEDDDGQKLAEVDVADPSPSPESLVLNAEQTAILKKILAGLQPNHREVLERFYLLEQPKEQIMREMKLSETQFRLLKNKAKTRLGKLTKNYLDRSKQQK